MEILDAQVHANHIAPDWDVSLAIDAAIIAMEAVGVKAMVVQDGAAHPRATGKTFSVQAAEAYPDRIGFITSTTYDEPDLEGLMSRLNSTPGWLALRVITYREDADGPFNTGEYKKLFELAARSSVPVFVFAYGKYDALGKYLAENPEVQLILDHCGVLPPVAGDPNGYPSFDKVLELAKFPNLALKWAHPERWSTHGYPFDDVRAQLLRAVDAFGAERIMWASDYTQARRPDLSPHPCSWSETLHYILDFESLSTSNKSWILGRSARSVLRWPVEELQ